MCSQRLAVLLQVVCRALPFACSLVTLHNLTYMARLGRDIRVSPHSANDRFLFRLHNRTDELDGGSRSEPFQGERYLSTSSTIQLYPSLTFTWCAWAEIPVVLCSSIGSGSRRQRRQVVSSLITTSAACARQETITEQRFPEYAQSMLACELVAAK